MLKLNIIFQLRLLQIFEIDLFHFKLNSIYSQIINIKHLFQIYTYTQCCSQLFYILKSFSSCERDNILNFSTSISLGNLSLNTGNTYWQLISETISFKRLVI